MIMQQLRGKTAIVTGAGKGIGKAISVTLGGSGASVVLAARTREDLEAVAVEVAAGGGEAWPVVTDVTDEASIQSLAAATRERYGRLDILVNNAGVTYAGPLQSTSVEDWDRVMAVNARGPLILCREVLALLKKAQPGVIVNISSVVGVKGYANQTLYSASKHAVRGMSIALAEELRDDNVRVHVICPGGVATDMVGEVRPDIPPTELIDPGEIAELVLYLVTHKGNGVVDEIHMRRATSSPWF